MKAVAEDLFTGLNPESEQEKQDFKVADIPELERIVECFEEVISIIHPNYYANNPPSFRGSDEEYEYCMRKAPKASAEHIQLFCITLGKHITRRTETILGLYLSALVAKSPDREFNLQMIHASVQDIGYRNEKNVIVVGDVGALAGMCMKGGALTIKGNTGNNLARGMEGGTLVVEGNAHNPLCYDMSGGSVEIRGSMFGYMMTRETPLWSRKSTIANNMQGGSLTHMGKLIIKEGEVV